MSYFPGEILNTYFIRGISGNTTVPLTETLLSGSEVNIQVNSSDEVVKLEYSFQANTPNYDDAFGIFFYRDSTRIYYGASGLAPVSGTSSIGNYYSWIDRPGAGTYTYSIRLDASISTTSISDARNWLRYTKIYYPENKVTITNSVVFSFS